MDTGFSKEVSGRPDRRREAQIADDATRYVLVSHFFWKVFGVDKEETGSRKVLRLPERRMSYESGTWGGRNTYRRHKPCFELNILLWELRMIEPALSRVLDCSR